MSSTQSRAKDKGKAFERKLVTELNLADIPARRVGHLLGKTDVLVDQLSAIQAKKYAPSRYPGWMTQELEDLLEEEPELMPALVIESAPGRGGRADRIVVINWEYYVLLLQLLHPPLNLD